MGMIERFDEEYEYPRYDHDATSTSRADQPESNGQADGDASAAAAAAAALTSDSNNHPHHSIHSQSSPASSDRSNGRRNGSRLDHVAERYASRDVELYASSFAPRSVNGVGGTSKTERQRRDVHVPVDDGSGGDTFDDEEAEAIDTITMDVRVRRDVQRRFLAFFGALLLLAVVIGSLAGTTTPSSNDSAINSSLGLRGNDDSTTESNSGDKTGGGLVAPLPSLGDVCARASNSSNIELARECLQECDKALCCTLPIDGHQNNTSSSATTTPSNKNCVADHPDICEQYEVACSQYDPAEGGGGNSVLHYRGQKIPPAPAILSDVCSEDTLANGGEDARSDCEALCFEYDNCCQQHQCKTNNEDACSSYDPCTILMYTAFYSTYEQDAEVITKQMAQQMQILSPAPSELADVCDQNALLYGGLSARSDCTSLCANFEDCCTDDACLANNTDACATYEPCENLLQPEIILDPSDVPTLCHGGAILTQEGLTACHNVCRPGLCCLVDADGHDSSLLRGVESCVGEKGADFCDTYDECKVLKELDDDEILGDNDNEGTEEADEATTITSPAPSDIENICSRKSLMSNDGFKLCKSACEVARCCWTVENKGCSTAETSSHRCEEYKSCSRLEGREPGMDDVFDDDYVDPYIEEILDESDTPSAGFSTDPTATKAKVDAACSASSILTLRGEENCDELCQPGACCASDSCGGGKAVKMNCSMYRSCKNLDAIKKQKKKGANKPVAGVDDAKGVLEKAEQVMETCKPSNLITSSGRKACEKLCLSHLCCFAPENDCAAALGAQCLEYAACKHLIDWEDR